MPLVNRKDIFKSGPDEDALTTDTFGQYLLNFGDLTTLGDRANGIFANADNVSLRNFGSVETSGLGAAGIFVQGENARIDNFGSVHTTGGFFGAFEFFSEGIFALGDHYHIANHGSVRVDGESSSCLVGVGEDGLVINFGALESSATDSAVIAAFGARSQAINAGQVTSSGERNGVMVVSGEDASALNLGNLLVTGHGNGMAGDTNTQLTNRGVIRFTLDDGFGDHSFGMVSVGDGSSQIGNFALIEMHGAFALGISALGRIPLNELGLDFEIVNAGRITTDGDLGIGVALGVGRFGFANAADGTIDNRGLIATDGDGAAGVVMIGDGHCLTNSGRITTDGGEVDDPRVGLFRAAGVVVSGDDARVENTRTGVIASANADSAAVELNVVERDGLPAAAMSSSLANFGHIEGEVLGGAGEETVINHGRIVGDVALGNGADTFVFGHGGSVSGDLFLGAGDDRVLIENGCGTAHVADFADGDRIDVSAFFARFEDLIARSTEQDGDVVIALDHNDQLVLANWQINGLQSGDFLFA